MEENTTNYLEQNDSLLDSVEFIRIIYILKKSIWWVFLFFLLSLVAGYLTARYTKPLYQSSSNLKLEVVQTSGVFGLGNPSASEDNNIFGEMELIKSEIIINEVADSLLPLKVSYFKEGKFLNDERYGNSPFEVLFSEQNIQAIIDKKVHIKILNYNSVKLWLDDESQAIIASFGQTINFAGAIFQLNKLDIHEKFEDGLFHFRINSKSALVNYLMDNLVVKAINLNANIIEVSFSDHNIRKAKSIVNKINMVYLKKTYEKKQLEKQRSIEYINDQLASTREQLNQAEKEIESFLSHNGVSGIEAQQSRLITTLDQLSKEKLSLATEQKYLASITTYLDSDSDSSLISELYAYELKNQSILTLLSEYDLKHAEFKRIENTNKKGTSAYQNSQKELKLLASKLKNRLKKQSEQVKNTIEDINLKISSANRELSSFPALKSAFNKLQRKYELYEGFYLSLEEKKIEYGIAKAGITPNFTILSSASSSRIPIAPVKLKVISIALAIATVISALFIFLRYLMYNTIISLRELEKLTQLPILGTIPEYKNSKNYSTLVVHHAPKSALSESLRSIRTSMEYFESKKDTKVVCFTSTISGEGKTFMSVNLAGILAMTEQKVVVIDLDMRKPKIHQAFECENGWGMSDLLIGRAQLEDCIHQSELECLDFITAGSIPPNPSEIIMRPEFDDLIYELSKEYKFIFIDSPPAGLVTDAHILMKKCDIPIYVIKAGYSSRSVVKRINRLYQENRYYNFSLALNSVQHQESYKSGYGGYGYGYYENTTGRSNNIFVKLWRLLRRK